MKKKSRKFQKIKKRKTMKKNGGAHRRTRISPSPSPSPLVDDEDISSFQQEIRSLRQHDSYYLTDLFIEFGIPYVMRPNHVPNIHLRFVFNGHSASYPTRYNMMTKHNLSQLRRNMTANIRSSDLQDRDYYIFRCIMQWWDWDNHVDWIMTYHDTDSDISHHSDSSPGSESGYSSYASTI
jgi:hypothetical protein